MSSRVAIATVLLLTALPGQKPGQAAEDLVIARLSAADPTAADAAMIDLMRGGPPSVPVLRAALARCKTPAFRARAERALAICAVDAPIQAGLKVGLRADRTELAAGDKLTLTATVCNVSDQPIALYLGMSYSGSVLENGLALQRLDATRDGGGEQARFGAVGFCGTGAEPLVEVLPPWTSKVFTMRGEYRIAPKERAIPVETGPRLSFGYVILPIDAQADQGKLQLRLRHHVDPAEAIKWGGAKVAPDWKGTFESNAITVTLRERPDR